VYLATWVKLNIRVISGADWARRRHIFSEGARMSGENKGRTTICAIVVNYNYAKFVSTAIESVLNQDDPFDEVVVVDDGSTDDSLTVIEKYRSRLKIIAKSNGGQMTASMAGIEATDTDYVYILDADDFVHSTFVEKVRPQLQARPAKVQVQLESVGEDGARHKSIFPTYPQSYSTEQIKSDNVIIGFYVCPPTSGNIYRRDILQKLELSALPPNDPIDGIGALAAPYYDDIVTIAQPLACYRVHGNSLSGWAAPTVSILQYETDRLLNRWQYLRNILGDRAPKTDLTKTLYVSERLLMTQCLEGRLIISNAIFDFVKRLSRANYSLKYKMAIAAWALMLAIPLKQLRKNLIYAKRSPVSRSALLKGLASLF
jgi:glycosyltransferase involved in cell wall biosynthesis